MTQSMYLVSKSQPQLGADLVNGVVAMLINAASTTLAKSNAAKACSAAYTQSEGQSEAVGPAPGFQATYFDTAVIVSSSGGVPGSGNGSANGDGYIMAERAAPLYVDHTAYSPS